MAKYTTTKTVTITCTACNSDKIVKAGRNRGYQRYECKACAKWFHTTGRTSHKSR
jgi:transposase-like protein